MHTCILRVLYPIVVHSIRTGKLQYVQRNDRSSREGLELVVVISTVSRYSKINVNNTYFLIYRKTWVFHKECLSVNNTKRIPRKKYCKKDI